MLVFDRFPLNTAELSAAPINPAWITSGNPVANAALLSESADGESSTVLWSCERGSFDWHYDFDETIYFLKGHVMLTDNGGEGGTRFAVAGNVVAFTKGEVVRWIVIEPVLKLAVCRKVLPGSRWIPRLRRLKSKLTGKGEATL